MACIPPDPVSRWRPPMTTTTRWVLRVLPSLGLTAALLATAGPVAAQPTPADPPTAPSAPSAPTTSCAGPTACLAACADGTGEVAACTAAADALLSGAGVAPDRAKAARLYAYGCGFGLDLFDGGSALDGPNKPRPHPKGPDFVGPPAPPSRRGGLGAVDLAACRSLGELFKTGWLFEVERDAGRLRQVVAQAYSEGLSACTDRDASGCAVAAWAARERAAAAPASTGAPPAPGPSEAAKLAERGCSQGRSVEACLLVRDLAFRAGSEAESNRLRAVEGAGLIAACKEGNAVACFRVQAGTSTTETTAVMQVLERACAGGDQRACAVAAYRNISDAYRDPGKVGPLFRTLLGTCAGTGHELCVDAAETLARGEARLGIAADPAAAVGIGERRCEVGDRDGCLLAAELRAATGPEALRDATRARELSDRSCLLTAPTLTCVVCREQPDLPNCQVRRVYREHERCLQGQVGACERAAAAFKAGDGVAADVARAAAYLRRGCDSAEKSACIALDELCIANPELPVDVCAQALIHSDLFYEAEYQLGVGGDVDLVDPDAAGGPPKRTPGAVTVADVAAQVPTSLRRGKLNADLVVDVVLDRARQAAVKLVVNELLTAERRARYRYLRDLLEQGAALLADPTTLRREKFQDLGMTVVRAFVAANLIDGLYPTTSELRAAPIIGPTVTGGASVLRAAPGQPLTATMHGYLVDVAYYWLGQTRLFGQPSRTSSEPPSCPWTRGPGAILCTQLGERATAERAIGVDKVLDGLRLAKALRDGGFEDLRRLIEAASRSRTIADLGATPGLTLDSWQTQLVVGSRTRLDGLREGLTALRTLTRASVYAETGVELPYLIERTVAARAALSTPAIRLVLGQSNVEQVLRIIRLIDRAGREMAGAGGAPAGPPPAPSGGGARDRDRAGALDLPTLVLGKLRKDVTTGLIAWGMRDTVEFAGKVGQLEKTLDAVLPALDKLEASIADVRALFARFPGPDGTVSLDVGNIPLYATGDLARELRAAQRALIAVDDGLRTIFPGEVQAQVRFARSATVRLVGFLDLMERVARSSALTQRSGDVVAALRLLGTYRVGVFDAPLYDVLEPVIDSIRTHEPMSLELLFAVIGKVRLDTLIGALQGSGNPCASEGSVDCWTTKLIHALQESVERDGDALHIDGGKFAQRLAQHGDDFRKRNTWRGYFHLTVGVGGLYSDPVSGTSSDRRPVPLISEQVGIGWASPAFWGDRLTFKVGAAASGLLYRAVLDSDESRAVMVHPLLLALDIGELVEAYVSPGMLLLYPPDDDRAGAVRWGFSAGLSVPLSAYLERL